MSQHGVRCTGPYGSAGRRSEPWAQVHGHPGGYAPPPSGSPLVLWMPFETKGTLFYGDVKQLMKHNATRSSDLAVDLVDYEVLVAVCGGIAAYKVCPVVSELTQRGAGVTVAMTRAATKFVGPLTFQTLSGRDVLTSLWTSREPADIQHIHRTEDADLVLIAPATANMIGKIAAGLADDLVSTLVTTAVSPVLLAPAMNDRMWANPIVQRNVDTLRQLGYRFIGPAHGWLACKSVGPGRMVEPRELIDSVVKLLKVAPPKAAAAQAALERVATDDRRDDAPPGP